MKKLINLAALLLVGLLLTACQKEFLDNKPDKALLIPQTLEDFNALMDNLNVFNNSPALQEISADDFFATDAGIAGFSSAMETNCYQWAADLYQNQPCPDWNLPYQQVFYANVILDGLNRLEGGEAQSLSWNTTKGSALFHRAFALFNLVQLFSKTYDKNSANTDLGIPLRLNADVNQKVGRSTVQQVYDQLLADLLQAESLLPAQTKFKNRPSQVAANALLARVYLSMENYEQAKIRATAALAQNHTLLDYNSISLTANNPFPYAPVDDNPEIIFYDKLISHAFTASTRTTVADALYALYTEKDLRKSIFFTGSAPVYVKGRYTGFRLQLFGGLSVDEMLLIKAECLVRTGSFSEGMQELNTLLTTRWVKGTFQPLKATSADEALSIVLLERRKELIFRGLRWGDLKRLNKDPRFAKNLTRTVSGQLFTLAANDKRYVFPIPAEEIALSGIPQNER